MVLANVSSNTTTLYSNFYNSDKNASTPIGKNDSAVEQNTNAAKNIILVKKGSTGYMTDIDFDENGDITLEELNKYCEENGVSEKDKIAMLTTIELSKIKENLIENNIRQSEILEQFKKEHEEEEQKSETNEENDEKSVYAKKGEDKYNEVMDNNRDGLITYIEYVKYCTELTENKDKASSKENKTYTNKKNNEDNEVISTVEYIL